MLTYALKTKQSQLMRWFAGICPQQTKKKQAFTLIEMSLVLLIIGLLLFLMLPNLNQQKNQAQSRVDTAFVQNMETQATLYQSNGQKPTWDGLVNEGYISKAQKEKALEMNLVINADGSITVSKT